MYLKTKKMRASSTTWRSTATRQACTAGSSTAEARATRRLHFPDSFGSSFLSDRCQLPSLSWAQQFRVNTLDCWWAHFLYYQCHTYYLYYHTYHVWYVCNLLGPLSKLHSTKRKTVLFLSATYPRGSRPTNGSKSNDNFFIQTNFSEYLKRVG